MSGEAFKYCYCQSRQRNCLSDSPEEVVTACCGSYVACSGGRWARMAAGMVVNLAVVLAIVPQQMLTTCAEAAICCTQAPPSCIERFLTRHLTIQLSHFPSTSNFSPPNPKFHLYINFLSIQVSTLHFDINILALQLPHFTSTSLPRCVRSLQLPHFTPISTSSLKPWVSLDRLSSGF